MIKINEKKEAYIAYAIVLLGAIVYISLTFNNNVWLDEAFTASLVNTNMAGVLSRSMADTLPPLYNILLKLSTDIFGYTVPVMKITSAVPIILTLLLGATVVRRRFGALVSYMFMLALIVMPNMMFFGVEIRMYSLGFFFATASGIFVYELICNPCRRNYILFTVLSVLAGYSHHFAFVAVGFVYFFLLLYTISEELKYKKDSDKAAHPLRILSFIKILAGTFALYFPCLLVTLKQFKSVSGYFSMPDVTLSVFIKYCRYPYTVGFTPLSIVLLLLVATLAVRLIIRRNKSVKDYYSLYCLVLFYGVLLFGTVISKIMTANIFVDRYLFFSTGLIWLFFAIEAGSLKKPLIYAILVLELAVGIASYVNAFASEYAPGADETIAWLEANVSEGDVLYTLEEYEEMAFCLPFYDNDLINYERLDDAIAAAGDNTIWCAVLYGYELNDNYAVYSEEIKNKGYTMADGRDFTFDRYRVKIYRLEKK